MNSLTRKLDVMNRIKQYKVLFFVILEHKLSSEDVKVFVSGYNPGYAFFLNNYYEEKTRMFVMWDTNI